MIKLPFLNHPVEYYAAYISGMIAGQRSYFNRFENAERLLRKKYGFEEIFNPATQAFYNLSLKDIAFWEYCMAFDLMEMKKIKDVFPKTIFLRIDPIKDCLEKKSGVIIENYYAIKYGFIICDLVGDEIELATEYISF